MTTATSSPSTSAAPHRLLSHGTRPRRLGSSSGISSLCSTGSSLRSTSTTLRAAESTAHASHALHSSHHSSHATEAGHPSHSTSHASHAGHSHTWHAHHAAHHHRIPSAPAHLSEEFGHGDRVEGRGASSGTVGVDGRRHAALHRTGEASCSSVAKIRVDAVVGSSSFSLRLSALHFELRDVVQGQQRSCSAIEQSFQKLTS